MKKGGKNDRTKAVPALREYRFRVQKMAWIDRDLLQKQKMPEDVHALLQNDGSGDRRLAEGSGGSDKWKKRSEN